jgi:hypothetical protein
LENWFEVEFILLKILRLQPSELDCLEFYRAEFLMENLKEWNEREKEQRDKETDDQSTTAGFDQASLTRSAGDMMKNASSSFNMPNFSMPKF